MRSLFTVGFGAELWRRPAMGQGFADIAPFVQSGIEAYQAYQEAEKAEEERKAAEEAVEAARAREEAAKAQAEAAAKAATATLEPTILGIPRDYVIFGGIGLAAVAVAAVVVLTR